MASLNLYTFKIAPGGMEIPAINGDYVRIEKADVPLWVRTENGDNFLLDEGEEAQIQAFTRLNLSHEDAAEQVVRIFVGNGARVGSAKVSGEVSVPGGLNVNNLKTVMQCSAVSAQKTVTSVSTSFMAANLSRAFLIIQNRHSVGSIYLAFGPVATVGNGIEIAPGESIEFLGGVVPIGEISAIGNTVSNSDIAVVVGSFI